MGLAARAARGLGDLLPCCCLSVHRVARRPLSPSIYKPPSPPPLSPRCLLSLSLSLELVELTSVNGSLSLSLLGALRRDR